MSILDRDPLSLPSRAPEPAADGRTGRAPFPNGRPYDVELYGKSKEDFILAGLALAIKNGVVSEGDARRYSKGEISLFEEKKKDAE